MHRDVFLESKEESKMNNSAIGLDIAKNVFHVYTRHSAYEVIIFSLIVTH